MRPGLTIEQVAGLSDHSCRHQQIPSRRTATDRPPCRPWIPRILDSMGNEAKAWAPDTERPSGRTGRAAWVRFLAKIEDREPVLGGPPSDELVAAGRVDAGLDG